LPAFSGRCGSILTGALGTVKVEEIHWADLEAEPVRGVLERFKKTGKLLIGGHVASAQKELFAEVPKAPSAL